MTVTTAYRTAANIANQNNAPAAVISIDIAGMGVVLQAVRLSYCKGPAFKAGDGRVVEVIYPDKGADDV